MSAEQTAAIEEPVPQTFEEMQDWVREQLEMEAVAAEVVRLDDARAMEKRLRKEIEKLRHQLAQTMSILRTLVLDDHLRRRISVEELESGNGSLEELKRQIVIGWLDSHKLRVGLGLQLGISPPREGKAAPDVKLDCENRCALCQAVCCRRPIPLSLEEVINGRLRWSIDEPFIRATDPDGYCAHLNRKTHECTIYEHRPAACRNHSCQDDQRIWEDFDAMQINPALRRALAIIAGQKDPLESGNGSFKDFPTKRRECSGSSTEPIVQRSDGTSY